MSNKEWSKKEIILTSEMMEEIKQCRSLAQAWSYYSVYSMQTPVKFSVINSDKIELIPMGPVNGFTEGTLPIFDRDISDEA